LVPLSLASQEPWVSRLEDNGSIKMYGMNATVTAKRCRLRGELRVGAESLRDVVVAVYDDSAEPSGSTALPIIGAPLLRRFDRVTFDFAGERVIFDRPESPAPPNVSTAGLGRE